MQWRDSYQAEDLQGSLAAIHRGDCRPKTATEEKKNLNQVSSSSDKYIYELQCGAGRSETSSGALDHGMGSSVVPTSVFGAAEEPGDDGAVDQAVVHGQDVRLRRHCLDGT